MTLHKAIPLASRHAAHAFEYATAAARIGAVGLTAADVRKTAVQLDNNTTWILTNHVGPVWQHVGDNVALVLEPCLVSPRAVTDADNGKTLIAAAFVVGGFQFVLPATATAGTRITLSTLANAGLDARILADATGTIVGGGCLAGAGVSELKATQEGASITLAYLGGPGKQWVVAEGLGSWIVQVAGVPTGDVYAFTPAITGGTLGGIVTLDADGQIADSTVALDTVVIGPAAATDHAIARYELATGKLIQDSLATVDDAGAIDIPAGQKYKINSVDLAASDVGAEVPLTFGDSLSRAVNTVALDNDSAAPGALLQYGTDSAGSKGWQTPFADATIPVPTGFAWASPGFDVFRTIAGYRTSIPWAAFRPTTATKVRYVDIATGSNSDPGDTWGNAWKGIGYALTRAAADPDITLIYVKAGRYSFGDGWDNTNVNHDLAVVADGGTVITSGGILASSIAWAPDGTFPNVYVGTRSASSFVVDHANLTVDGNGTHLTSRASVALVDANPGSFFISGASVYVRTVDSRAPDANVEIIMGVNGPTMNGANNYYVEGLDFRGGNSAFYCTNATRGVFVNSKFRYSLTSNGLDTDGTANVYVYGCEASENCADGFNYHTTTYVVEQGCVGYGNGWGLAGSNNGSSQHENNAIIRVGCTYRRNNGPQIADITTADSWNVGVEASHPFGVAGWQSTGIYSEGNQWLHDCYCHDCDYDIYEAGAETTYTFNTRYTTHFGTLVAYAGAGTGAALVPSGENRIVNRLPGGTTGNLVTIDADDDFVDSGVALADLATTAHVAAMAEAGGSDMTVYSNIAGDFQVTWKDADEINVFDLPASIAAVQIKRITRKPTGAAASVIKTRGSDLVCTWTPDAAIPLAGVIATTSLGTLAATDEYIIEIDGPPKGFNAATDSAKTMVTNALHYVNDGVIADLTADTVDIILPLLAEGYNAFSMTAVFGGAGDNMKVYASNDPAAGSFQDVTDFIFGAATISTTGAYQTEQPLMFQYVKFAIDGGSTSAQVALTRFRK